MMVTNVCVIRSEKSTDLDQTPHNVALIWAYTVFVRCRTVRIIKNKCLQVNTLEYSILYSAQNQHQLSLCATMYSVM